MLIRKPLPHQREASAYASTRDRIALFMEMRLGKSLPAIRWAQSKTRLLKLIVAPLSAIPPWEDELRLEGISKFKTLTEGSIEERARDARNEVDVGVEWFITNFESLRSSAAGFENRRAWPSPVALIPWDLVIVDESIRIKNPQAQITQVMMTAFRATRFKAILTGLPCPEGPLDFFEQMRFLHDRFMGYNNYYRFRSTYFLPVDHDWHPKLGLLKHIKNEVAQLAFCRTQKQVGMNNRVVRQRRYVSLPPEIMKAYGQCRRTFTLGEMSTKYVPVVETWLARICGGAIDEGLNHSKANQLLELLQGELKGQKVVIWFRFNAEIAMVRGMLKTAGIHSLKMTGKTPKSERGDRVRRFKQGKVSVLLLQIKIGLFALDLSCSDTAIYYSYSASHNERSQSEARIQHPKKKKNDLLVLDLICKGTVEEKLYEMMQEKKLNKRLLKTRLLQHIADGAEVQHDPVD